MSSETTSVIISVCGIAAVVGVLIILAGFLVVRIFKTSIFSMAMMAMKIVSEPKDESSGESVRAQSLNHPKRDLRAQARSMDFDSAVARQGGNRATQTTPTAPPTNPVSAQSVPPPGFETPATSQYPSLKKRRRKSNEGEDEELDLLEAFGDDE
jgi:hypothetical protein